MGEAGGVSAAIIDNDEGWITSKTGKKYRLLEQGGRMVREYESGAILDDKTLKIAKPIETKLFTSEKAVALNKNRWAQAEEAAIAGMIDAFDGRVATGDEAWRGMMKRTAQKGLEDDGQAGNRAVEIVGRATGYLRSKTESIVVGGNGSGAEQWRPETWQLLERIITKADELLRIAEQNDPVITTDKGTNHELLTDGGDDGG